MQNSNISQKSFTNRYLLDRKLKRIFEPSNGGIGIKLKTPKIMFITTIRQNINKWGWEKLYATLKRIKIPKIIASKNLTRDQRPQQLHLHIYV